MIADAASGATVLLGIGDGTFRPAQFFTAGSFPTSVAVRDFNGDGMPDMVVTNSASRGSPGAVFLLLGNGDGTFQAARNLATVGDSWSVAVGDFDGDGKPDLALANADAAYVLLGNGDGTFQSPQLFSASGDGLAVGVGDFDGDGQLDLAVSNLSSTLSVLKNNTAQAFPSCLLTELTVNNRGSGSGRVTSISAPANMTQISCPATCSNSYPRGTAVTLTATPRFGSVFLRWVGCDAVSGSNCTVSMVAAKSVTAVFLGMPSRGPGRGPYPRTR